MGQGEQSRTCATTLTRDVGSVVTLFANGSAVPLGRAPAVPLPAESSGVSTTLQCAGARWRPTQKGQRGTWRRQNRDDIARRRYY